jgi:hypothetical protein
MKNKAALEAALKRRAFLERSRDGQALEIQQMSEMHHMLSNIFSSGVSPDNTFHN